METMVFELLWESELEEPWSLQIPSVSEQGGPLWVETGSPKASKRIPAPPPPYPLPGLCTEDTRIKTMVWKFRVKGSKIVAQNSR